MFTNLQFFILSFYHPDADRDPDDSYRRDSSPFYDLPSWLVIIFAITSVMLAYYDFDKKKFYSDGEVTNQGCGCIIFFNILLLLGAGCVALYGWVTD